MKNKLTKTALALGSIASIAAPIAAVVSCGSAAETKVVLDFSTSEKAATSMMQLQTLKTGTFDIKTPTNTLHVVDGKLSQDEIKELEAALPKGTTADAFEKLVDAAVQRAKTAKADHGLRYNTAVRSEIELHTTFSATGPQFKTLDAIVQKYNTTQQALPGFKKVKLVHVEGGYGTIGSQLEMKFGAHSNEIPNMFIDYADAAGYLTHEEMELDLKGTEGQLNDKVLDPMNEAIAGTQGETVILPISQSAEMLSVDAPLMKFLITSAGGTLDTTDGTYTKKIADNSSSDFGATGGNGWSAAKKKSLAGHKITDADFASYEKLFDLAGKIAESQGLTKTDTLRVLGLDSAVNALYEIAYSKAKADDSKFLYSPNSNGKWLDYNLFGGGSETSLFKDSSKMIADAIMDKSTKVYGGGAYASSDETHHQLAMAIGSTAGYSHNYIDGSGTLPSIDGTNSFDGYVAKVGATTDGNGITANDLVFVNGSHTNKITDKPGNYDFGIATESIAKAKTYLASHTADTYLVKGTELPKGAVVADTLELKSVDGKTTKGFLVVATNQVSPAKTTLQEDELVVMPAPTAATATSTKVAFLQGPGIIGVHNNTVDDAATKTFTKWFTAKGTVNIQLPYKAAADFDSPLAAWAAGSEYAVSLKNGITLGGQKDLKGDKYVKGNFFVTRILEGINAASTDAKHLNLLSPGADEDSATLRTDLQGILKGQFDASMQTTTVTAGSIYSALHTNAVTDSIIE